MSARRLRPSTNTRAGAADRTLLQLLDAQPAAFKKDPRYASLSERLRINPALRQARLTRLAWRLLNEPRLKPQFVANFMETYRQPKDPFYRSFLELKWDIKARSSALRSERAARIDAICAAWPEPVKNMARWLTETERLQTRLTPVCNRALKVTTLKAANLQCAWSCAQWLRYLGGLIKDLERTYPGFAPAPAQELLDWMLLESLPEPGSRKKPAAASLKAGWRRAGKRWHPDCADKKTAGFNPEWFRAAEEAARRCGIR